MEGVAGSHSSCESPKNPILPSFGNSDMQIISCAWNFSSVVYSSVGILIKKIPLEIIWLGFFPLHSQTHSYICTFLFLPDAVLYLPQFSSFCQVHRCRLTCTPAKCQTSESCSLHELFVNKALSKDIFE